MSPWLKNRHGQKKLEQSGSRTLTKHGIKFRDPHCRSFYRLCIFLKNEISTVMSKEVRFNGQNTLQRVEI